MKKTPDYDNVFKTMKSKHKRLFPYIPFYIARYEKELASGDSTDEAVNDLEYFRNGMVRLHKDGELSDDEIVDLMGFVNTIITHITDGNRNEERLVNIMGGTVIETESEKLIRRGKTQDMLQGMLQSRIQMLIEIGQEKVGLSMEQAAVYLEQYGKQLV